MDSQEKSFKSQFWRHIKNDMAARDVMDKVPSSSHNRVVRLLEAVSDPACDGRLRRFAPKLIDELVPSNKKLTGLADRLRTIGNALEKTAKMPGFILGSDRLLEFAKECSTRAGELSILKPSYFTRYLSYKSFWKCVPAAMLCRELVDSKLLSFGEVEKLVRCADNPRGRTRDRPKRSIERQYKRFMKYTGRGASPLLSAAWPVYLQELLDLMLKMAPTR